MPDGMPDAVSEIAFTAAARTRPAGGEWTRVDELAKTRRIEVTRSAQVLPVAELEVGTASARFAGRALAPSSPSSPWAGMLRPRRRIRHSLVGDPRVGLDLREPGAWAECRGLDLAGPTAGVAVRGTGDFAWTANPAAPGDLDVMVRRRGATSGDLVGVWATAGDQRSWALIIDTVMGTPRYVLRVSTAGTSGTTTEVVSTGVAVVPGSWRWVRVVLDCDDGAGGHVVTFYGSATDTDDWSQVVWSAPDAVPGSGTLVPFASSAPLTVGLPPPRPGGLAITRAATVHAAGVLVADPVFAGQPTATTVFDDGEANTWELAGAAVIEPWPSPQAIRVEVDCAAEDWSAPSTVVAQAARLVLGHGLPGPAGGLFLDVTMPDPQLVTIDGLPDWLTAATTAGAVWERDGGERVTVAATWSRPATQPGPAHIVLGELQAGAVLPAADVSREEEPGVPPEPPVLTIGAPSGGFAGWVYAVRIWVDDVLVVDVDFATVEDLGMSDVSVVWGDEDVVWGDEDVVWGEPAPLVGDATGNVWALRGGAVLAENPTAAMVVLHTGFVEAYQAGWAFGDAWVDVPSNDLLELIAGDTLPLSALEGSVLTAGPVTYWPLGEEQGATSANDRTGNRTVTWARPGGAMADVTEGVVPRSGLLSTSLRWDGGTAAPAVTADAATMPAAYTIEVWYRCLGGFEGLSGLAVLDAFRAEGPTDDAYLQIIRTGPGDHYIDLSPASTTGNRIYTAQHDALNDGAPHCIAATWDGANATISVDGVPQSIIPTVSGTAAGSFAASSFSTGAWSGINIPDADLPVAALAHVALYDRVLTGDEIADHTQAGLYAWSGDTVDERLHRILDLLGIDPADRAITPTTQLLGPAHLDGMNAVDYLRRIINSDQGVLWVDGPGRLRYLPYGTGAAPDLGPLTSNPDLEPGIPFMDVDPTYSASNYFNSVVATRPDGRIGQAVDQSDVADAGTLLLPLEVETIANEIDDLAARVLARSGDPREVLESLTIASRRDDVPFELIAAVDVGWTSTVHARPPGDVLAQPSVVESVEHVLDFQAWDWTTTLRLAALDP